MEWYEKEGFDNNPFEPDPLKHSYGLVGQDKGREELVYRILSGGMVVIEGKPGSGKTHLLKHAIDNFRGEGKVIYVDGKKLSKHLNIEKLLKGRVFKKIPKDMILLLDNVQNLTRTNSEKIKYYYDQDNIKSVIFTTDDYAKVNFTDSIRDRVGKHVLKLKDLSKASAVEMVKARLNGKDTLNDDYIEKVIALSEKNPADILANSAQLYEHLVKNGKEVKDIKKVIHGSGHEEPKGEERCDVCSGKLAKVKDAWRCPTCDTYCTACGALVDEKDDSCPGCGASF